MYGSLVLVSSLPLAAALNWEDCIGQMKINAGTVQKVGKMPIGQCEVRCEQAPNCRAIAYHTKDNHCHIMLGSDKYSREEWFQSGNHDHDYMSCYGVPEEHDDEEAGLANPILDVEDEDDAIANSTPSLRSLLSPRDGVSSTGAPKLEGVYCGWASHDGPDKYNQARVTFSGDKMHLEWKKSGTNSAPCKGPPKEHECCLCQVDRKVDCKDEEYKVAARPWDDKKEKGYDVQWTNTGDKKDCITKAMGVAKDNTFNNVPLRIKIHDENHLDLFEGKTQDGKLPDGMTVDLRKEGTQDASDVDGPRDCSTWDKNPHALPCRRRAGCKSRLLPVPSKDEEGTDEEFDDEEFDFDDIEVV